MDKVAFYRSYMSELEKIAELEKEASSAEESTGQAARAASALQQGLRPSKRRRAAQFAGKVTGYNATSKYVKEKVFGKPTRLDRVLKGVDKAESIASRVGDKYDSKKARKAEQTGRKVGKIVDKVEGNDK